MADWVAISSLATAGGTLALAATTYASVRSANRAARAAERSLLAEVRPLLVQSSAEDQSQRVGFADGVGLTVAGGEAAVEVIDGRVYVVISLRNVGSGIAVVHGGYVQTEVRGARPDHALVDDFTLLTRDIYIPAGEVGFWQISFHDDGERRDAVARAIEEGVFAVEILYGDYDGGQRAITRLGVFREEDGAWHPTAVRHWRL